VKGPAAPPFDQLANSGMIVKSDAAERPFTTGGSGPNSEVHGENRAIDRLSPQPKAAVQSGELPAEKPTLATH
jgi:hypothetical protein